MRRVRRRSTEIVGFLQVLRFLPTCRECWQGDLSRLHEPGLIFNPGQCATGGYFFILFTWTRVEGDSSQPGSAILNPGQQFSTRAGTYNIPSNALEPSVFFRAKVRIMADNRISSFVDDDVFDIVLSLVFELIPNSSCSGALYTSPG